MESILARALEYTLKYWLKSFTRDQFKLQGRTAQLSDLDINGDVLHASMGLPPALNVATARVGKLEITLPAVSYVQVEPIVIHIDKLDLVLQENADKESTNSTSSGQSPASAAKASGYGFADKIADGMTIEVGTVNLLVETRGGSRNQGGATWSPPLASITIRNLLLYTTNENWKVVNLKEARDFSNNKDFIYVFKKLEWGSLSIDLLPHPDMFTDERLTSSSNGSYKRDDDGAKRLFFGGERFLEGISGQAHITVQRTQSNSPLGLEVQLHIPEAVCPALSEPGLRALLRFMTGFYVCLNRGDVDPKTQQRGTEAAGRSLVSIIVDHIFLCIKDAEFQLELLMQSLCFSRSSVSDGENTRNLSQVMISGLFLRDTFSHPPCTLIQPSMFSVSKESLGIPEFGENFCPAIYPLECENWQLNDAVPLICLHSLQITPSPAPPIFASQTVISCQPLTIVLQEESCLRISSFIADGILVNPGDVLPDFSVNSLKFSLKEFDLTVPLNAEEMEIPSNLFSGARLHVEDLIFVQSPSIKCKLLNLDKDPACFSLWECQPIDASQRKLTTQVSHLSLSLETCTDTKEMNNNADWSNNLWRCVELHDACFEAAMVTADGNPLLTVPPPEGIVRIGVACQEYSSNASVEQIFFVLGLYAYFDQVSEKITTVSKTKGRSRNDSSGTKLMEKLPSDTAVSLAVTKLNLQFLEESSLIVQGMPLLQFVGDDFFVKVSHRTLGGAFVVSTNLNWGSVCINCVDQDVELSSQMRTVFWIDNQIGLKKKIPFLDIRAVHVMPYNMKDVECHSLSVTAKIYGVRLGGGMNYTESLMHRFGILGPDGGPGEGLSRGVRKLSSGPFAKLFKSSHHAKAKQENGECSEDDDSLKLLEAGMPDDVDVAVELNNWLFALEGNQELYVEEPICSGSNIGREERCWHTSFQKLLINGKSNNTHNKLNVDHATRRYPVELITVGIEGLQALKPRLQRDLLGYDEAATNSKIIENDGSNEGVNVEVSLIISQPENIEAVNWIVENIKFSVEQPIETVIKKEELEHLVSLCRSEIDSMGRIVAGILRLLKLDKSIGQATINQLSNLGTDSLDKIFTPEKLSRQSSNNSISLTPRSMESTISLLEVEILESQDKCLALITELGKSEFTAHKQDIEHLNQKLESMQSLLTKLRTMI